MVAGCLNMLLDSLHSIILAKEEKNGASKATNKINIQLLSAVTPA